MEPDHRVRLYLATAAVAAPGDRATAERFFDLAGEALLSFEPGLQTAAVDMLAALAVHQPRRARQAARLLDQAFARVALDIRLEMVRGLGRIGCADATAGGHAIRTMSPALLEVTDYILRSDIVDQGLAPIASCHSDLAPRIREILEALITDEAFDVQGSLRSHAWETWLALAMEPAAQDLDFLWPRLRSSRRFGRRAALVLITRLAVEEPRLTAELRSGLERHLGAADPHIRLAAAEGLEVVEIIRRARSFAGDPEARACWREAIAWLPIRKELTSALSALP